MRASLSAKLRVALALAWFALLALAGWAISQRAEMSGDLRKFMPAQTEMSAGPIAEAARAACASDARTLFA